MILKDVSDEKMPEATAKQKRDKASGGGGNGGGRRISRKVRWNILHLHNYGLGTWKVSILRATGGR